MVGHVLPWGATTRAKAGKCIIREHPGALFISRLFRKITVQPPEALKGSQKVPSQKDNLQMKLVAAASKNPQLTSFTFIHHLLIIQPSFNRPNVLKSSGTIIQLS